MTEVFIEAGQRRVFASALAWPGWARSARTDELAVAALAAYLPRCATVVKRAGLLEAAWAAFAEVAETAPERLRKGPRGGGRDTAQIVEHVFGAEAMYARKMGLPKDKVANAGPDAATVLRRRISAAMRDPAMLVTPSRGWPPRTAARRIAWHVLDHQWEIGDKSEPG